MKNRTLTVLVIFLISIAILWPLCPYIAKNAVDGHLPSQGPIEETPSATNTPSETPSQTPGVKPLFNYFNLTEDKPELRLSLHVLEIDPKRSDIQVRPVTSHKTLFGYEYLSAIHANWKALASVNGGFSHPAGLLGGLFIHDNELMVPATGQFPILFMGDGKAFIKDAKTKVWIKGSDIRLENFYFNRFPTDEGIYVFTPAYGSQNRIEYSHLNAVVSNGEVRGLIKRGSSYEIPADGFLISAIGQNAQKRLNEAIKPGMMLELGYDILSEAGAIDGIDWAYECGSWIVKDGEVVVPEADKWVGTLETRTPRTAVGIKEDGSLVFVVADGRQKALSDGLSGKELAARLLALGIKDAAFLDGGASSEMIIEGEIVNSPSAGRERMVASAFVLIKND